jgi:hypothetical protein
LNTEILSLLKEKNIHEGRMRIEGHARDENPHVDDDVGEQEEQKYRR